ncbi:site-2 protease family protein [Streptomyces odonnellii]|uniref:site-2 protease family protein n=1 Tax=Streptomyces odonnellii TaxID=1417980 RepID=UPI00099BD35B|nr:site-2 protease family protein [Streptomyces odonnellii]
MRATFSLGRIAGVRIGVHWSVLVIFVLILVGLAQGRFPLVYPGHAVGLYWIAGLVTSVLFFASLLAHELAHAVVARRNGVQVDDIVLWLLGGVARLRSEAQDPGAELRIAGVGPLVSLILGGLFTLCTWLFLLGDVPRLIVEAAAWLAAINVLLAVFNAIPAAPLDGGRLLRALLWWRTGDRLRATAGATAAGRVFGWLLVVAGFVLFIATRTFEGLWLALIGWFLIAAATAEGREAQMRSVLAGVPVRHAMTPDPVTAQAGLTVAAFLADPRYRYRYSAFPVTGELGDAAGLITLDRARHTPEDKRESLTVGDVMLPLAEVTTAAPDDPLADLLPRMSAGADNRVLVLDRHRVLGIISSSDIGRTVSWLIAAKRHQVDRGDRDGRGGKGDRGGWGGWGQRR